MPERSTGREGAGSPPSSAVVSGRAWRRIIIVSAAVSALIGGLSSAAAQALATESPASHQDRLAKFEQRGCQELQVFPKHGWVCVR